jgi:antitoxin component of RelBE/YafQ-DinJ toxin-antitoxin module
MTTSLYIDDETKQMATKKAKEDRLSFSAVVRILVSEYAQGKIVIGARSVPSFEVSEVSVDKNTQKKMDEIASKWRNRKK